MCAFCFSHKSGPTVTPSNTIVSSLLVAALVAVTSPASASVLIFTDPSNADANWTIVNQSGFVSAGFQATGGNPSNTSYRQITLSGTVMFVGELNNTFVYNPSVQGAITGITYNADFETLNAAGSSYFPLVSQNGSFYLENSHGMNASANTWLNQNLVTDLTQFVLLQVTNGIATFDFTKHPDFSAAGSSIDFGYEAVAGGAGPFTSITGMANDPITVTFTPLVSGSQTPLPGALPLFAGGLGIIGLLARRRKRKSAATIVVSLLALAVLLPEPTRASPITRTYEFIVNNIHDQTGNNVAAPVTQAIGSFTVTFDPTLGTVVNQTTGITVNSLNVTVGSPIAFSYNPLNTDEVQIGGLNQGTGGLTEGTNDFLLDIFDATGATPFFGNFEYTILATTIPTGQFSDFAADSRADGIVTVESTATPLPAGLPLFVSGLGALGLLGWREKRKAMAVAA